MSDYPELEAKRRWKDYLDLGDGSTRELFDATTIGEINSYIETAKRKARADYKIHRALQKCLEQDGLDETVNMMVMQAMYGPEKKKTDSPDFWEAFAVNLAHWIGGERGMRIGADAAKQMISDAKKYAENQRHSQAPWLDDVEGVEDEE